MRRGTAKGGGSGGAKRGLQTIFEAEIATEVEALISPEALEALDFEALETSARRRALELAARAVEQRLNSDHTDHVGAAAPCDCGQTARYAGRRAKRFETVLGSMHLERAYYDCLHCQKGFCPRDRVLGLEGRSLSPAVTRMVGTVGALVSFQEGSELLSELSGIEVGAKQVERTSEALGREIAAYEQQVIEPVESSHIPQTLYLGVDGTGVPMRRCELTGRPGKQPDGSAKTREVKLCTLWSAEARDDEDRPVRDRGSVSYSAAIETAATQDVDSTVAPFWQRVEREAKRRGFDRARRQVFLGDGALWIWNLADELFPRATQIVDLFHAMEHLSEVARAIYGASSDLATAWARQRYDELEAGDLDALLGVLRTHQTSCEEARKAAAYFQRNQHRMRYHRFRAKGLCTSTGVVEAGCKVVVGHRLKRAGMHWSLNGANAILALRCARLSGRFEMFWNSTHRCRHTA